MTQIVNEFGFDATKALQTIQNLNGQFNSLFQTLNNAPSIFSRFNSAAGGAASSLAGFNSSLRQSQGGARSFQSATNTITRSGKQQRTTFDDLISVHGRYSTSLALASRVAFTQTIVSGLQHIKAAIRDAIADAAELEQQFSKIQSIAPGADRGRISDSARTISDSFNIEQTQAASAIFQALQNDVGTFDDSLRVAAASAALVKTAGGDVVAGVDALSSAVNAFGLNTNDLGRINAVFLQTTKDGRITVDDLNSAMARLGPRTKSLGGEVEEMAAAVAAITSTGSDANEAITQLSGILTALTKPTESMSNALRAMGYETAQQAVQSEGLVPLLEKIRNSTDGTSEALAKLFPNVRAVNGAYALTGDNLDRAIRFTQNARNATSELGDEMLRIARDNPTDRLTSDFNRLKNILIETAKSGLTAFDDFIEFLAEGQRGDYGWMKEVGDGFAYIARGAKGAVLAMKDFFLNTDSFGEAMRNEILAENQKRLQVQAAKLEAGRKALAATKKQTDQQQVASDNSATQQIIANSRNVLESLKARQQQSLSIFQSSQQQIAQIKQNAILEKNARPQDLAAQSRQLLLEGARKGDEALIEEARSLFQKAQSLQKQLASSGAVGEAVRLREITEAQVRAEKELQSTRANQDKNLLLRPDVAAAQREIEKTTFRADLFLNPKVPAFGQSPSDVNRQYMFGGRVAYFNTGGVARGTDTVPAMLSRGETVIDAQNSRRFFSQINSIRAGVDPSRNTSNSYTTNVGDVNVTVRGGDGETIGREVMRVIRRQQRRGAGRI